MTEYDTTKLRDERIDEIMERLSESPEMMSVNEDEVYTGDGNYPRLTAFVPLTAVREALESLAALPREVTTERRAPVQASKRSGSVTWAEHLEAWAAYDRRYHGQSAERIAERGGFDYGELVMFLGHEPTTYKPVAPSVTSGGEEQG